MTGPRDRGASRAIDEAVEAYESARARDGRAELDAFLPAPDHPHYLAVLCELVRVDMECGFVKGRPGRLDAYERRYSELFRDLELVREIAFEEYRLRQQAGESPSAAEYRDRYDVDGLDRPAIEPDLGPSPDAERPGEPTTTERWSIHRRQPLFIAIFFGVSIVLAASLAALEARKARIERLRAVELLDRLGGQVGEAEFLMSQPDAPIRRLDAGIAHCRRALDPYGAATDPRWTARSSLMALSAADQARARRGVGEILALWAAALSRRAESSIERRAERIEEASKLLNSAEAAFGPAGPPRALKLQEAELARLAGRNAEADRLRAEGAAIPLRSVRERLLLVSFDLDRGLDREALALAEEASRLDPLDFSAWLVRGRCLARVRRSDQADQCFQIGIELRPGFAPASLARGELAVERRDFDGALANFDRALKAGSEDPDALYGQALAKLGRGDARGTIAVLDRLLKRADAPTRALFLRVEACLALGDEAAARSDRSEGLTRVPGDEESWVARGRDRLHDHPDAALMDFRAARNLNARWFPAIKNEALVLSETLGRDDEAVKLLDRALADRPQSAPALTSRSTYLGRLGRREEALKDVAAALALDRSAETLYVAACTFALTSRKEPGDAAEALRLLARAARQGGDWGVRMDSEAALASLRDRPDFRRLRDAIRIVCPPPDAPK